MNYDDIVVKGFTPTYVLSICTPALYADRDAPGDFIEISRSFSAWSSINCAQGIMREDGLHHHPHADMAGRVHI